jgi:hypothetical protein
MLPNSIRDSADAASHWITSDMPSHLHGRSVAEVVDEVGTVEGLPSDLSINPLHMQGFGDIRNNHE